MIFYPLLRKALFEIPAEEAHHLTMKSLKLALRLPLVSGALTPKVGGEETLARTVAGIHFPNPVGIAAGFDKNALYIEELSQLGFGFVEIGTVTPRPQAGNAKPRLFRLPKDKALINRMGFNNDGAQAIAGRLAQLRSEGDKTVIGGNIGKNKDTANEDAEKDYLLCLDALYEYVDYFVVNVSSPNTPNLRALQDKDALNGLLGAVQNRMASKPKFKPVFLKIAPDLGNEQLDEILVITGEQKLAGIIATNTTISRSDLSSNSKMVAAMGAGGLSGAPLQQRSFEVLQHIMKNKHPELAVISSGGIMNAAEAERRLKAGADLVQLYTGFIYRGPDIVVDIKKALLRH